MFFTHNDGENPIYFYLFMKLNSADPMEEKGGNLPMNT